MLCSKIKNAHWAEKPTTTRCGIRESYIAKLHVVAVFKQQPVVAWEKQPQCKMSFKWTVYKFSNLLIKNACNVGLMKKNGKAHLFLQELLEWHIELHFIFFERYLHFLLI